MLSAELFLALEALVVLALAALLTAFLRRPRLHVEASLRGSTRDGTLYVVVTHRKGWAARGVRVQVYWRSARDRSAVLAKELGTLHVGDALRLEVDDLQKLLPAGEAGAWEEIVVRLRAWNAFPARERLRLARRGASPDAENGERSGRATHAAAAGAPPVQYARTRELPCPERPDGRHVFEERPYMNDGVLEHWRVCRACRHAVRDPLTPEQEETQRRVRAARAERLRRIMEDEFARLDEEERARTRERARSAPPPRDRDEYPVDLAFFVLELDPARATWPDVAAAHRRLALAHHPDRHAHAPADQRAAAERRMQEINAARDRLREHFGVG